MMTSPPEFLHTDEDGTSVHAVRDADGDVFMTIWPDGRDDKPVTSVTLPAEQVRELARLAVTR